MHSGSRSPLAFAFLMLASQSAWAELTALETLTVPATTSSPTTSSIVLEAGTQYWLLAQGTYRYATGNPARLADAEWAIDSNDWLWYESISSIPNTLDLAVDGEGVDWWGTALTTPDPVADMASYAAHVYSSSHTYWYPVTGDGTPLDVFIADTSYGDNSGSLQVTIYSDVPSQQVVLMWGENAPFSVWFDPLFSTGPWINYFGSTPAETNYGTPGGRDALRDAVQDIFTRAGVGNVLVSNYQAATPPSSSAVLVYMTNGPGPGSLDGYALDKDRFNSPPGGRAIVFTLPSLDRDADNIAHEVGHVFGLRHVDPVVDEQAGNESVMDYDYPDSGHLPNFVDEMTPIWDDFFCLPQRDHNPVYHLRRWVASVSPQTTPGVWDQPGFCETDLTASLSFALDGDTTLFDVVVRKGYDRCTQVAIIYYDQISLSELSQLEFIIEDGEYFGLNAASSVGGELDVVLAVGDPYEPQNAIVRPIDGTLAASLQQATETEPFYTTIEQVTVTGSAGPVTDCNVNALPDDQDIATGASLDCNGNVIPDECDIADGTVLDVDGSGIPDACEAAGDSNGDGVINTDDLMIVLNNWGPCSGGACPGDTDFNGVVNVTDLLLVLANWS